MDNPGVSLFNNGVSLQLDAVNQQEREEEEEEAEEQRRIEAELAEKLEGAFDDLDLDEDGDDSSMYCPPNGLSNQPNMDITPGQVPLKYVTSTPFVQPIQKNFQINEDENRFHQLPIEETTFEGDTQDVTNYPTANAAGPIHPPPPTAAVHGHPAELPSHHPSNRYGNVVSDYGHQGQIYANNGDVISSAVVEAEGLAGRNFTETLNKSDIEKVRERALGSSEQSDLMVLYTARGREIERLEALLNKDRDDHAAQLRSLRTQLANTALERHQHDNSNTQLEQLLADSRRENTLLKDEVYSLKATVSSLQEERDELTHQQAGDKEVVTQLQEKLRQLETSDTVLRARQQHDAVVRSMKERHETEAQKLRSDVDQATSRAREVEAQYNSLRDKFEELQNKLDFTLREKTSQIDELSSKLAESQAMCVDLRSRDQSAELNRLSSSLKNSQETNDRLEEEVRRCQAQIKNLKLEIGGYEAMSLEDASESFVALGLSGPKDGSVRLKEELHRSISGNKSKREEIARLESLLTAREAELGRVRTDHDHLEIRLNTAEAQLAERDLNTTELERLRAEVGRLKPKNQELEQRLEQAEKQNVEVKKCMTAMLEGQSEDQVEAIDSLREEYEEHCRNAVSQTKSLMEGEVRRLKIELDVYTQTVAELRRKLDAVAKESQASQKESQASEQDKVKISELEAKLRAGETERSELTAKLARLDTELQQATKKLNEEDEYASKQVEIEARIEKEFVQRFEKTKQELRQHWENSHKGDIEEAVAVARLDWLKRLPEVQREGGAARESVGQLDLLKTKVSQDAAEKEKLVVQLSGEQQRRLDAEKQIEGLKTEFDSFRRARSEEESRLRDELRGSVAKQQDELRNSLTKQQEQWQASLAAARTEAENQRAQITQSYETEIKRLEERLRRKEEERTQVENKLDQIETEYGLALDKWKRVLEDKNKTIEKLQKSSSSDVDLLRTELNRRVEEVDQQRREMAAMAERWEVEVRNIQESHTKERQEAEDVAEKYRGLKAKVRKYQRHVESKENHYKQEYARLESEFKTTLERLRERMEQAYTAKEREVEQELGNMRDQFTQELKNIAARKSEQQNRQQAQQFEDQSLKKYYIDTSNEIQKLLK